jgi:hypothetical protein
MTLPEAKGRQPRRRWLIPLLWLIVPALAAVIPWFWQRQHAQRQVPGIARSPLSLTGDRQRDRRAILERARDELLRSGGANSSPIRSSPEQAALMGEIGVALLPLDPANGTAAVEQAIRMAANSPEHGGPTDLNEPERSRTGVLLRLARSLRPHPSLAGKALGTAYDLAQRTYPVTARVFTLCLFAREAADIDAGKARSALRIARGTADRLPVGLSPDAMAVVAATVARLDGREAAAPLVQRVLRELPSGRARPLVEARLAAALAGAAPLQAHELARQSLQHVLGASAGHGSEDPGRAEASSAPTPNNQSTRFAGTRTPDRDGPLRAIAVFLAATHPDVAQAAASQIRTPAERAAALVEMGSAAETRAPSRAAALYRRALAAALALAAGQGRHEAVIAAATGLAAFDLTPATNAVLSMRERLSPGDLLMLSARAAGRQPAAAAALLTQIRLGDPRASESIEASEEVSLAVVTLEPDLPRALDLAQHQRGSVRQARALLAIARRLAAETPKVGAATRRLGGD